MFVDVALPKRRYQVFTYLVPAKLQDQLKIGSRVLVPLGRTSAQGLVFRMADTLSRELTNQGISKDRLREIHDLIDTPDESDLDPILLDLARQVTDYYLAPIAAGLRLVLPPAAPGRVSTQVRLTDLGRHALENSRLAPKYAELLTRLSKSRKGLTLATIRKTLKDVGTTLARLKQKGWIEERERVRDGKSPVSREHNKAPFQSRESIKRKSIELPKKFSHPQNSLISPTSSILQSLSSQNHNEFLVYDSDFLTQERLLASVLGTLDVHRSVLIITPEVNQVSRLVNFLADRCGNDRITMFHGDLTPRVRTQRWHEIQEGRFDIVVGTRMALFVPIPSLGLVWVDHEEDSSYKEEQSPYYHVRDVARMRAKREPATLVLSSDHPSLETIHHFSERPPAIVSTKVTDRRMPNVQVVNLRETPYGTLLSDDMIRGMQQALDEKGSVILFLNRKGFSRSMMCKDCGYVPQCSPCGVTLTMYKKPPRMVCSYCGQTHLPPVMCPDCQSIRLEPAGFGTERLEEVVQQQFPSATVARFDSEIMKTPKQEAELLARFQGGAIDIVIGTELLFHRQMIRHAKFVGVPYADSGLHIPDFRSAERTYHLLVQAVQLAEGGSSCSEVILQTFLPSHHVIRAVAQHDPEIFHEQELAVRKALGYPPFTHLIQVAITGKFHDRVAGAAKRCRDLLVAEAGRQIVPQAQTIDTAIGEETILGPIPSFRSRSPGISRNVILIKSAQLVWARQLVQVVRGELELPFKRGGISIEVNVDPIEIS